MTRPSHIWILFAVCLAVLLTAMGWVSLMVVRLDRFEAHAHQQAELEENLRLALWRMDSFLTPLIVEESARPYFIYTPFHTTDQAYTKLYSSIREEVLIPSPLLTFASSNVLLHFQFDVEGRLTSPQVPIGNERDLAEASYTSSENIETAAARLVELQKILNQQASQSLGNLFPRSSNLRPSSDPPLRINNRDLLINLCAVHPTNTIPALSLTGAAIPPPMPASPLEQQVQTIQGEQPGQISQQRVAQKGERLTVENQMFKNTAEWKARASVYQKAALNVDKAGGNYILPPSLNLNEGPIKAVWISSTLVLARRVALDEKTYIQGCWLNWTNLKHSLLATIEDLFPAADLQPVASPNGGKEAHMLAFLPAKLTVAPQPFALLALWTPIRISLAVAWACVLLAALAVAVLLHGAVSLSERRGAFVSSVTHELRTPLTTFKMYSEMLAEGMVQEKEKRRRYLDTLCSEANRLSHLVENVLAYARLERGSIRNRLEKVVFAQLIERLKPRLVQRAEQAGMELLVHAEKPALDSVLHVDVTAAEQILFNLVDNACKYAAPTAAEKLIHLEALRDGEFAMLRVRDHGLGISRAEARRLFRPFSKSAHEAARTAPGVGLGLALCQRLSRSMGGDLRFDPSVKEGACFILTLPVSQAHDL